MNNIEKRYKLLLVDDEEVWSDNLKEELEGHNFEVFYENDADKTLKQISAFKPDAVLLDILFNQQNRGKPIFDKIKEKYPYLPVIILTSTAVDSYNDDDFSGRAFPYPKDSLKPDDVQTYYLFAKKIRDAIKGTENINNYIDKFDFVVGKTEAMQDVCRTIIKAAKSNSYVLITGEEGTGKELVAKAIHRIRARKGRFILVHCGALTDTLIESELFGICAEVASSVSEKEGLFEQADNGTIFLDEIGTMPLNHQVKLLRVLQDRKFSRVGSTPNCKCKNKKYPDHSAIAVDIRVIAATNIDIPGKIKEGIFKKDLFDRLNVINIHMPPLRQRKEDIEALYKYFISTHNKRLNMDKLDTCRPDVKIMLGEYDWPGNLRELSNSIERAMSLADSTVLLKKDFPQTIREGNKKGNELYNAEVVIDQCIKEGKGYNEFKDEVPKNKMAEVLEGICRRYYEKNRDLTEDLLVPVLKFNTRANLHRVLNDHGISTIELKQRFKNMKGSE